MIKFEITQTAEKSRLGVLKIQDKEIKTPCFIPQSTGLNVQAMFADSVKAAGFDMIYADIYRPLLRMGLDSVNQQGGIAKVMGFDGLIFLGSGAGGIASAGSPYKVKEDGVNFSAYTDGSAHKLSPESSIRISRKFKGNIISGLFEEPKNAAGNRKKIGTAVRRTTRWTRRASDIYGHEFHEEAKKGNACFFAPVTGGAQGDLRMQSATEAIKLNPDGFLQLPAYEGEPKKAWFNALQASMSRLPEDKPTALIGVDNTEELYQAVLSGVDMIIADFPIKDGLKGIVYTENATIDLNDEKYFADKNPIVKTCDCPACKDYTLSYLHHLFVAGELTGPRLAVWHNLSYVANLMESIRAQIAKGIKG